MVKLLPRHAGAARGERGCDPIHAVVVEGAGGVARARAATPLSHAACAPAKCDSEENYDRSEICFHAERPQPETTLQRGSAHGATRTCHAPAYKAGVCVLKNAGSGVQKE